MDDFCVAGPVVVVCIAGWEGIDVETVITEGHEQVIYATAIRLHLDRLDGAYHSMMRVS